MSYWSSEFETAWLLFLLIAPLAAWPLLRWHRSRFGQLRGWPLLLSFAALLYACALVAFPFFPWPDLSGDFCQKHAGRSHWQLVPLESYWAEAQRLWQRGPRELLAFEFLQEFFNIVFFLPLGFLLAYRFRWAATRALLAGAGLSACIELAQGTGLFGLMPCAWRLGSVDDVISNGLGAWLGAWLGTWTARYLPEPGPPGTQA